MSEGHQGFYFWTLAIGITGHERTIEMECRRTGRPGRVTYGFCIQRRVASCVSSLGNGELVAVGFFAREKLAKER